MELYQVLLAREDLEEMIAVNILLIFLELEPYHQIQFRVIHRTFLLGGFLLLGRGYSQHLVSLCHSKIKCHTQPSGDPASARSFFVMHLLVSADQLKVVKKVKKMELVREVILNNLEWKGKK